MTAPTRPVLRYHGGKWKLAPWVISFFPPHRIYVEPFGGAASVLMQKARSPGEVYNDIDADIVNFFRVLRDPVHAAELRWRLEHTPFARDELAGAYDGGTGSVVDRAVATVIKATLGQGTQGATRPSRVGFNGKANDDGYIPAATAWRSWPEHIESITQRLQGVVIEHRDARELIAQYDTEHALLYVDPPYVKATRSSAVTGGNRYRHELTDADHAELADQLLACRGMVVLSGYPSPLYDRWFPDWTRHERPHLADGARPRTEVLWINPACDAALQRSRAQPRLIA